MLLLLLSLHGLTRRFLTRVLKESHLTIHISAWHHGREDTLDAGVTNGKAAAGHCGNASPPSPRMDWVGMLGSGDGSDSVSKSPRGGNGNGYGQMICSSKLCEAERDYG